MSESDDRQRQLAADLHEQADLSEKFGHAARALSSVLASGGETDAAAAAS